MAPIREGRSCDPAVILSQIGARNFLAISGGRASVITDEDGETIGVALPCGANRIVEVTLHFLDTYTVRRYRRVVNGANAGSLVLEHHAEDIYCHEVGEAAYTASCWR